MGRSLEMIKDGLAAGVGKAQRLAWASQREAGDIAVGGQETRFWDSVAYCGFPAAIDALRVAEALLAEQGLLPT